jgi:hypothetical protein
MKKLFPSLALLSLIGILISGLAGCQVLPQVSMVEGQEREDFLVISEPMADNLFTGLNTNNYEVFSRDFDTAMKKALNEKSFAEMEQFFSEKLGAYQSRTIDKVERAETILTVTYTARFEHEEAVSVRLSVRETNPPELASLWFDSPKLREK